MLFDLRYALRRLVMQRAFTFAAVATLAGAIAANTAIFSLVDGVLLRPLPLPHPEQLVRIEERHARGRSNVTGATVEDLLERSRAFSAIGAFRIGSPGLSSSAAPEQTISAEVSPRYFDVLGVEPHLGRLFQPHDFAPGAAPTLVLSDAVWRRMFGGDRAAISRDVLLNAVRTEIIGVMPARLFAPGSPQIWIPRTPAGALARNRRAHLFTVVARLANGQPVDTAQAELEAVSRSILADSGGVDPDMRLIATDLHARTVEAIRPALLMLWAAVGLLLLIGAANIANLLLMQGAGRVRELSIRTALGAARGRLLAQLALENLLLGIAGGVIGSILGIWAVPALAMAVPASLPRAAELTWTWRVIAFGMTLSVAASTIFGFAPALRASSYSQIAAIRTRVAGASGSGRLRFVLVTAEVSITVILLVAAGLLARSFVSATRVDLGFDPSNTLAFDVSLPSARYPDSAAHAAFHAQVLERIQRLPAVVSAASAGALPMGGVATTSMEPEGVALDGTPLADVINTTPDFLSALGVPLKRGRFLGSQDRRGTTPVVAINEAAAYAFWPDGRSPVGLGVTMKDWGEPYRAEVIGVVGNVRQGGPEADMRPAVYYPQAQFPETTLRESIVVRVAGDPLALIASVREQVSAVDPDQAIASIRTMENVVGGAMTQRRLNLVLIAAFAAAALVLAAVGIYGVVAFAIGQRLHEIGVRVALGAQPRDVAWLTLSQGLGPLAAGSILGVAGALTASSLLERLLFGVRPADPLTIASVLLTVGAVGFAACLGPALKALHVDPVVVLRAE
jgi:putative ABC transport system permease protein